MDYPFSSKEKGFGNWPSPIGQHGGFASLDGNSRSLVFEEAFSNVQELMDIDAYAGWCNSPIMTDQMFASYGLSPPQIMPTSYTDAAAFPGTEVGTSAAMGCEFSYGDKYTFQGGIAQFNNHLGLADGDDVAAKQSNDSYQPSDNLGMSSYVLPKTVGLSLSEKMLRALSFFKQSSGRGILAQVWVPIKHGDKYILSTYEQPYLLDQMLAGYRELSRNITFSTEGKPGSTPGLPGRVFMSEVPEWTSNVNYYNTSEYLRAKDAVDHDVRGSIAIPIFDPSFKRCCAVLEIVTMKEKPNFDPEMETVCRALQAVNLTTTSPPRLHSQVTYLSANQRAALAEITDVLRAICHAHSLPLALTWIPCTYNKRDGVESLKLQVRDGNSSVKEKYILCIEDSACYVNDKGMQGFVHACKEHHLEEGQGVPGKALQSNIPFFFPDVKEYDISGYPLVQHARKFGLNAAVSVRLRSTYTGDDDYVVEFFLPVNMKGSSEQQLLLNNLAGTMQKLCRSLRTISDAEFLQASGLNARSKSSYQMEAVSNMPQTDSPKRKTARPLSTSDVNSNNSLHVSDTNSSIDGTAADGPQEQGGGSRRNQEKKRSTAEKNISVSALQQYFSGSLKDAAKSLGVCPTTLKRICRHHGISRWPSRKINKVNRSLRKIQTVLDSVEGVEGGLKFDPTTGELVASGSIIQDFDAGNGTIFPNKASPVRKHEPDPRDALNLPSSLSFDAHNPLLKSEDGMVGNQVDNRRGKASPKGCMIGSSNLNFSLISPNEATHFSTLPWGSSENTSSVSFFTQSQNQRGFDRDGHQKENSDSHFRSHSSISMGGAEINNKTQGDDGIVEHNRIQPSASSMTDSSNASGSRINSNASSSPSHDESKHAPGSQITVKATYRDDTVRFKFDSSSGCFLLYEEISKRFKLQTGALQLKYLDDEEEWVSLTRTDSDLQECLEVLDLMGSRSVKLLVLDMPGGFGSSGGSNGFLTGTMQYGL